MQQLTVVTASRPRYRAMSSVHAQRCFNDEAFGDKIIETSRLIAWHCPCTVDAVSKR